MLLLSCLRFRMAASIAADLDSVIEDVVVQRPREVVGQRESYTAAD